MLDPATLQAALEFRRDREWEQFHTPLNLAIAISVEAGELLQHFQWMQPAEVRPTERQQPLVAQELADIAILLSYLANDLGIDLNKAVQAKLVLNAERYPIEKARGSAKKYNELE